MPNKQTQLVLKCISIGLSHDLTYLEEIKYSTSGENFLTNSGKKSRKEEYVSTYRRMYLALVTLGCIIPNYALRRLCFQSAKVCEPKTDYSSRILEMLPECDDSNLELDSLLLDIRYQLTQFQYDIRNDTNLPKIFEKASNLCLDKLDFFNRRVPYGEDFQPLEYPGVEKYLKRQAVEDKEHISKTSDLAKCKEESEAFNVQLGERLKILQHHYYPKKDSVELSDAEVKQIIQSVLGDSGDFQIFINQIFYDLDSISLREITSSSNYWNELSILHKLKNKPNMYIDYEFRENNNRTIVDLDSAYLEGCVNVWDLFCNRNCVYDVENIIMSMILNKKMSYQLEEFRNLNKTRNVETDLPQKQIYAGFLYLANRHYPEYARLCRLATSLKRFDNVMEYYLEYYLFDSTPGVFKFKLKYKKNKIITENLENINENNCINNSSSSNNEAIGNETESVIVSDIKFEPQISTTLPQCEIFEQKDAAKERLKKMLNAMPKEMNVPQIKVRREKVPPAIVLTDVQTCNTSPDIQKVFRILESEVGALIDKQVKIDTSCMEDASSPHFVHCFSPRNSILSIKKQRCRNGMFDSREVTRNVEFPLSVVGKLIIMHEYRDTIEYDEFLENPFIKSTDQFRIICGVTIEHLSHNIKFELDCLVDNFVSKIKCSLLGGKARLPRKPVAKPLPQTPVIMQQVSNQPVKIIQDTPSNIQPNINVEVQQIKNVSKVQETQNVNEILQTQNISEIHQAQNVNEIQHTQNVIEVQQTRNVREVPNPPSILYPQMTSTVISYPTQTIQTQSSAYLPSYNIIASSGQFSIVSTPTPQYSQPMSYNHQQPQSQICYTISTPALNQNILQAPTVIQSNQIMQQQQHPQIMLNDVSYQQMKTEESPSKILVYENNTKTNAHAHENVIMSPKRIKVEVLKVETISPSNEVLKPLSVNGNGHLTDDESSRIIEVTKTVQNGTKSSELVDFEAQIQLSMVKPQLPAATDQKRAISVEEDLKPVKSLPSSPPPLHYPKPNSDQCKQTNVTIECQVNSIPLVKEEKVIPESCSPPVLPAPIAINQHSSPKTHQHASNVIMKKKKKSESNNPVQIVDDFIDLTDDASDVSIDLTRENRFSIDQQMKKLKSVEKNAIDIAFVSCTVKRDETPFSKVPVNTKLVDNGAMRALHRTASKLKRPRSISPIANQKHLLKQMKVQVVDVMKEFDKNFMKKDTSIRLKEISKRKVI
jgi:hypothetical protein